MQRSQFQLIISVLMLLCWNIIPGNRNIHAVEPKNNIIRVGIIGLDTPHASAFTRTMNAPDAPPELQGCKVVAAMPYFSPDIEASVRYAAKEEAAMKKLNVELVATVEELLKRVDVVCLESQDGRPHLKQALPVLKAGKPIFVDKPVTNSLVETIILFDVAKKYNAPIFSSSSLRYTDGAKKINAGSIGDIRGCDAYSPCPLEKNHADFFWYGIHGVETLFTVIGPGCKTVTRIHSAETDVAVGVWNDGRVGTFRGRRKSKNGYAGGYGGTAFGSKGIAQIGVFSGYKPLVVEIVKFFKTKQAPVTVQETLNIYAFMEAADESKRKGGIPISLEAVLTNARAEAKKREH